MKKIQEKLSLLVVAFLNYAKHKGVETFYITNRKMVEYEGTEKNLKALGFPDVNKKQLLLRTETGDKQPRRDIVAKDYGWRMGRSGL